MDLFQLPPVPLAKGWNPSQGIFQLNLERLIIWNSVQKRLEKKKKAYLQDIHSSSWLVLENKELSNCFQVL